MKYIKNREGENLVLKLSGNIHEDSEILFMELQDLLDEPALVVDCEDVHAINSVGISAWVLFFKKYTGNGLVFRHVTPVMMNAAAVIREFFQDGKIASFVIEAKCEKCNHSNSMVATSRKQAQSLDRCTKCSEALDCEDDIEDLIDVFERYQ